jgi:hypothetical protein
MPTKGPVRWPCRLIIRSDAPWCPAAHRSLDLWNRLTRASAICGAPRSSRCQPYEAFWSCSGQEFHLCLYSGTSQLCTRRWQPDHGRLLLANPLCLAFHVGRGCATPHHSTSMSNIGLVHLAVEISVVTRNARLRRSPIPLAARALFILSNDQKLLPTRGLRHGRHA